MRHKAWGDDLCPTCMCEISFDYRCDPSDISIAKHTDAVRNVLRSTQLLDTIQTARHTYNRDSTEQPEPISMGPNFFVDGEGHSENDDNDLNEDESEDTDSESNNNSSEGDENSNRSGEDSDPSYPSEDDNDDLQ
jgi:hypothetical protein